MKVVNSILTNNPCYRAGRKIAVKGLMLHSVGCSQPSAQVFVNSWNKSTYNSACVHAFIDANNGDVYQTLPWDHRAWHCGSGKNGSGNNTHIGVEMCEPSTIKYTGGSTFKDTNPTASKNAVMTTYNSAVELFAMLCRQHGLDPMKDIISHAEGHALGIASNHGDPEHLWKKYGLTMDGFRKAVKAVLDGGATNTPSPYKVRVTASTLNIREGAGTQFRVTGQIKNKGVYTIVEESGSWGKLKSGAGWISLKYTEKV